MGSQFLDEPLIGQSDQRKKDLIYPNINLTQDTSRGPDPETLRCPYCDTMVYSGEKRILKKRHYYALIFCLSCYWLCTPCVYGTNMCLEREHYCAKCHKYLGLHKTHQKRT
ncbi:hypothetical protein QAD02_023977 [Eretmocerus hayati]|uniref:Uncharacterized protein n=1 Tax=Eretmocerus hayati TaxID=131215 RepID=A0ACC2Q0U8_9HYME|nr:hypothetical protein QAD02_023977 [Eretmocerus hayati]